MAVDTAVFADEQNGVVVVIPVITPTSVDTVEFVESKENSGIGIVKLRDGNKNAVFVS